MKRKDIITATQKIINLLVVKPNKDYISKIDVYDVEESEKILFIKMNVYLSDLVIDKILEKINNGRRQNSFINIPKNIFILNFSSYEQHSNQIFNPYLSKQVIKSLDYLGMMIKVFPLINFKYEPTDQ